MKLLITLGVIAICLILPGCEKEDKLKASPETVRIGTFDGCEVKYVNRGYMYDSFFMARCDSTVTTTTNIPGKGATRVTNITVEIERLQAEKAKLELAEQAIGKLTPAEKAALGIN